jgi:hypothetical protein
MGVLATCWKVVKAIKPWLEIQRENNRLKKAAEEAKQERDDAVATLALRDQTNEWLRKSFGEFREEFDDLKDRFEHQSQMLASALLYIVDLHQHKSGKTPLPPMPEDLRAEFEAALERRMLAEASAPPELSS